MRILHVTHQYPPDFMGGVEQYTAILSRAQAANGHAVSVFTRVSRSGRGMVADQEAGVTVWRSWSGTMTPLNRLRATFGAPALFDEFCRALDAAQPDVVHLQHLMGLPAAIGAELARRRIPVVITLHDFWWICANAQLLTNDTEQLCDGPQGFANCARCLAARGGLVGPVATLAQGALRAASRRRNATLAPILGHASRLIAPSRFVAAWYQTQGADPDKVLVLPHGIDRSESLPVRRRSAGEPHLHVLVAGGITRQKGLHLLAAAAASLSFPVAVEVAGDQTVDPAYAAEVAALGQGRLHFLGRLDRVQLWQALVDADLLAAPSIWYETFSLIVHEAHAAGAPVVAPRLGALAEAVADEVDGLLVAPNDVSSLAAALARFHADPALRMRLHAGAAARPLRSVADHVQALDEVYFDAVHDRA